MSRRAYDDWHIDGAVLWNVYTDLKDADYRLAGLARAGTAAAQVGDRPGYDGRVLRLRARHGVLADETLRSPRRAHPRLLTRYLAACRAPAQQRAGRAHRHQLSPRTAGRADPGRRRRVRQAIADPGSTLLDVRTEAEFRGERFWPSGGMEPRGRAGHVPTAVHLVRPYLPARTRSCPRLRRIMGGMGPDGDTGSSLRSSRAIWRAPQEWPERAHRTGGIDSAPALWDNCCVL